MTQFVIANNVNTQLAAPASNAATTLTLASSANLPTLAAGEVMPLVLNDAATGMNYEVVYVTAITGANLTVIRGQEGTAAVNWSLGDAAYCAPTAGSVATANGNPSNTFLVAPATLANQAMQFEQAPAVVGAMCNGAMSIPAASASATFTADQIVVFTALGGLPYCLSNFNETLNLATVGAGGMDTGVAPVSGLVALYAIFNPTAGAAAILAQNAGSAIMSSTYSGAHMAAGYTASALISVWPTTAAGLLVSGIQRNNRCWPSFGAPILSITAQQAALKALVVSNIPANAKSAIFNLNVGGASSGLANLGATVSASAGGISQQVVQIGGNGSNQITGSAEIPIITPQTVYYSFLVSGSFTSVSFNLGASGYTL